MTPAPHTGIVRLHVRSFGRTPHRDGSPFVLLHGLGVSGVVWTAFARRQLGDRTVIAPDLRGHGESDSSPDDAYAISDYAADIAKLISDRFGGTPVALVGHSLGGLIAIEVARIWPKSVGHLVVLDPPTFGSANARKGIGSWKATRDYPALLAAAARVLSPGGAIFAATNARELAEPNTLRDVVDGTLGRVSWEPLPPWSDDVRERGRVAAVLFRRR